MNKKVISANSTTTDNPWDKHSEIKEIFEHVKSGLENNKGLNENWLWEEKNKKLHLLSSYPKKGKENNLNDFFFIMHTL